MKLRNSKPVVSVLPALLAILAMSLSIAAPAYAGAKPIGLLAGGVRTTIDGQEARSDTSLFKGNDLQVQEHGLAIVKLQSGGEMVLGEQTAASFNTDQEPNSVTLRLKQGRVALFQPDQGKVLRVQAGDFLVEPAPGLTSSGEVALLGGQVYVTARKGALSVNGDGMTRRAMPGKPIIVHPRPENGLGAAVAGAIHAHRAATAAIVAASVASPIAIAQVAAHAPPQACEHAASPSVPAAACSQ